MTTNNANTEAKVLNVIVEFKVEIVIRFITLKMILLFSVYIGCFTGTAKIIREVVDILIYYNSIHNNPGVNFLAVLHLSIFSIYCDLDFRTGSWYPSG